MFFCVWTFIDYCILIVSLCDCHTHSLKFTYLLYINRWPCIIAANSVSQSVSVAQHVVLHSLTETRYFQL